MNHELYIFGSLTRGDVTPSSDVDILVIPSDKSSESTFPSGWSVYGRDTIAEYFSNGRLFAWHLYLESKVIYCPCDTPWLFSLGAPKLYATAQKDIAELRILLSEALCEIRNRTTSLVYEFGLVYTAIRDIAMSASKSINGEFDFSRHSPYQLKIACPLEESIYQIAIASRHCSMRGTRMPNITSLDVGTLLSAPLEHWVDSVLEAL